MNPTAPNCGRSFSSCTAAANEGAEIKSCTWNVDQVPGRGIEQVKEWYAGFPVKASACVECGVCVERCPFDVDIIAKMREAAELFEAEAA
jgi:predicted aldo/keto reductase-like oxidoreductase